jgi:hypothetical protein
VKRILIPCLLTALALGVSSCSDKSSSQAGDASVITGDSVSKGIDRLDNALATGAMMGAAGAYDRKSVKSGLEDLSYLYKKLLTGSTDVEDLKLALSAVRLLEGNGALTRSERNDFAGALGPLKTFLQVKSKEFGVDFNNVELRLFNEPFTSGIRNSVKNNKFDENKNEDRFGYFMNFGHKSNWVAADEELEQEGFAVASGNGSVKAWLISPSLDLTTVKDPSFRIKHTMTIDRKKSEKVFDRTLMQREVFKAFVSTDYKGGKPEDATWEQISLGKPALIVDLHKTITDKISLKKYEGQKATIAFVYEMKSSYGKHYNSWTIDNFEVWGKGGLNALKAHSKVVLAEGVVFFHNFLGEFPEDKVAQATLSGEPAYFKKKSQSSGDSFVQISGYRGSKKPAFVGERILHTQAIDLTNVPDAQVSVLQAIRLFKNKELGYMKVVAFEEADLALDQVNFTELNFTQTPNGKDRDPVQSEWLTLPSELQGKKVKIGFIYKSTLEESATWSIYQLQVKSGQE